MGKSYGRICFLNGPTIVRSLSNEVVEDKHLDSKKAVRAILFDLPLGFTNKCSQLWALEHSIHERGGYYKDLPVAT